MDARRWRWRSTSWPTSSAGCRACPVRPRVRRVRAQRRGRPAVREILIVAGESSGDLHAAGVARELVARSAPFKLVGVGGDQMRAAGVELIEHTGKLAVMGFVEVLET